LGAVAGVLTAHATELRHCCTSHVPGAAPRKVTANPNLQSDGDTVPARA